MTIQRKWQGQLKTQTLASITLPNLGTVRFPISAGDNCELERDGRKKIASPFSAVSACTNYYDLLLDEPAIYISMSLEPEVARERIESWPGVPKRSFLGSHGAPINTQSRRAISPNSSSKFVARHFRNIKPEK